MPLPRFVGCIVRRAVDQLSWPPGVDWRTLSDTQKGEVTVGQAAAMMAKLTHRPLYYEHPEDHVKVKIGEVVHNYLDDDKAWKVVVEINDGTPAGRSILEKVRAGKLKGLSLSHDTRKLKPIEVSLVDEGFRCQTGIESELDLDTDIASHAPNNKQEYIVKTAPEDYATEHVPPVISASVVTMSNQSGLGLGILPAGMGTNAPPQQLTTPNQHVPPPAPQAAFNNNQPPSPPQQQTQEQQASPPPPPPLPLSSPNPQQALEYMKMVAKCNLPEAVKTGLINLYTANIQEAAELKKQTTKLDGELQMAKKISADSSLLFHDTLVRLTEANKPINERMSAPQSEAAKKLAIENPHAYQAMMLPDMIKASRLQGNAGYASHEQNPSPYAAFEQQQQQPQPVQQQRPVDCVPSYHPSTMRAYNTFEEAVRSVGASYNGTSVTPAHFATNQPQMIQASNNKRQRGDFEQGQGAGAWYQRSILPQGTVNIFAETEDAARRGFGEGMSLRDVRQMAGPQQTMLSYAQVREMLPPDQQM